MLTGATGFLGSRVLRKLVEEDYKVVCTRRAQSDFTRVADIYECVEWVDTDRMDVLFDNCSIDIIIHCATDYGRADSDYFRAYEANLVFPLHLIQYAKNYGCRYFIHTGTFFCRELDFEKTAWERVYLDAYVHSKDIFCKIIRNHIEKMDLAFINLQMEHIYGSGDGSGKFVNYLMKCLQDHVPQIPLSSGEQKRDWLYVEDAVSAYMAVLNNLTKFMPGEFYHLEAGTGMETSVKEFACLVKEKMGSDSELGFGKRRMSEHELKSSHADNKELCILGWEPKYDVCRGIDRMIKESLK